MKKPIIILSLVFLGCLYLLARFGVAREHDYPSKCAFDSGFECTNYGISSDGVWMELANKGNGLVISKANFVSNEGYLCALETNSTEQLKPRYSVRLTSEKIAV